MRGLIQERPLLLSSLIEHAARYHGEAEIVSRTVAGATHRYTYAEAAVRARRLASALPRLGIGPGEIVGSLAWNHYRHFELFFAIPGAGVVLHTANPRLFPEQVAYTINHARERWLFLDSACLELVEELAGLLETVEGYVILAGPDEMPRTGLKNVVCYEELLAEGDDDYTWPGFDERTASSLCYTSGTTGDPKGVLCSHRGSLLQAWAITGADNFGWSSLDCVLPAAPFYHCNGWSSPYAGAMTGAKLVLPGRVLDSASLHELIEAEAVSFALGVPTIWLAMLEHLKATGGRLDSLERIACGGSAPPEAMMAALERDYGVRTIHAWGMTETTAACTFVDPRRALTWAERRRQGVPLYGSEVRVADDAGRALPQDGEAVGHLEVRGHWIASDYFRAGDASGIDSEGWLPTGDVGTIDASGSMEITDRAKDLIKSGGEWISSIALENAAVGHDGIAEAGVIAVAHPKWQERPFLVAVRAGTSRVTAAELLAYLAERVPKWWLPDAVVFVDELPHTATGKIKKTELRVRFRDYSLPQTADPN